MSLAALLAVEVASLNPVWYCLVASRWGATYSILARVAFSSILARWDLTTIGRISLSVAMSLPLFLESGMSLPSLRYLGMLPGSLSMDYIYARILLVRRWLGTLG